MVEPVGNSSWWSTVTQLIRNHDGDSCWLEVQVAFRVKVVVNVRLARINSPKLSDDGGYDAKYYFSGRIMQALLEGKEISLKSYKTEKFGRWLGDFYIQNEEGWEDLNQDMIDFGYAVSYDGKTKAE